MQDAWHARGPSTSHAQQAGPGLLLSLHGSRRALKKWAFFMYAGGQAV